MPAPLYDVDSRNLDEYGYLHIFATRSGRRGTNPSEGGREAFIT